MEFQEVFAQLRQRRTNGHHRQRSSDSQHDAHHHIRRQAEHPAGGIRADALTPQQFDNVAILLQHARPATVMQAGARHAGYTGEQRRNGK